MFATYLNSTLLFGTKQFEVSKSTFDSLISSIEDDEESFLKTISKLINKYYTKTLFSHIPLSFSTPIFVGGRDSHNLHYPRKY